MFPRRVSILGVGLLGGSLGLACRRLITDCEIIGYAHNAATADRALRSGAVHRTAPTPAAAVAEADLVVLCTPVGLFHQLLEQIAHHLPAGAIVTDVGSTKASVCADAQKILPPSAHFVGSHPMAGSEKRGLEFARAELYQDALCILTPIPATDRAAMAQIDAFWQHLGMRTTQLSPADHDRLIAQVSHVPHAVAAALVAIASDQALPLAGKGFFDTTRIAAGDGALWRDILIDNADHIRAGLVQMQATLADLDQLLRRRDGTAIQQWLDAAAAKRHAAIDPRNPTPPQTPST